jgi:hypothetical protein
MTAGVGLETGDSGDSASLTLASAALSYSSDVITRLLSTDATECWDRTTSFYGFRGFNSGLPCTYSTCMKQQTLNTIFRVQEQCTITRPETLKTNVTSCKGPVCRWVPPHLGCTQAQGHHLLPLWDREIPEQCLRGVPRGCRRRKHGLCSIKI